MTANEYKKKHIEIARLMSVRPSSEEHLHHPKCLADPQSPHYCLLKQLKVTCVRFITHACVSRLLRARARWCLLRPEQM